MDWPLDSLSQWLTGALVWCMLITRSHEEQRESFCIKKGRCKLPINGGFVQYLKFLVAAIELPVSLQAPMDSIHDDICHALHASNCSSRSHPAHPRDP